MEPTAAAVWGVYFHAVTGETVSKEVGEDGAMASDFIDRLPAIQRRLRHATSNEDTDSNRPKSSHH
jgi:NAD(P)H-hydrate repair Nnr-like enzyme with NAD(P)H-hydrate dehydratase domain